jgi:hypothetical protein
MPSAELAVVSLHNDLHAFAMSHALKQRHGLVCHVVASDSLANSGGISWESTPINGGAPTLPTVDGKSIDVRRLAVLWWRRINGVPQIPDSVTDEAARDLIANDCRASLTGILHNEFHGTWISHYEATRRAEVKPIQMNAALKAGFRAPRTLISQDPARIREFCRELDQRVVVKTVAGTQKAGLTAAKVSAELLASDAALRLAPAIYQELVEGGRHLRIHVFGERILAALISSGDLDWRIRLSHAKVEPYALSEEVKQKLYAVLRTLDLRMGIFDFKLTADDEPIWFEINPQGQFLFVEGMGGLELTNAFTDFISDEVSRATHVQ